MKSVLVAAVAAVGFASNAHAQALADRVPADTLAYFGWSGTDALSGPYANSHLKAVLDETRVRDLFGTYLDQVEAKLVANKMSDREPFELARTMFGAMWRHPSAMFFAAPEPGGPPVRAAMLCRAGAEARDVAAKLDALLADAPKDGPPLRAAAVGDVVVFSIGYDAPEKALADASASLAKSAAFADAVKQTVASPAIVTFVNPPAALASIERSAAADAPADAAKVKAFLDASGLRAAKAYVSAAGFDGKDWVSQSFLSLPASDRAAGLWKSMPDGPIDASLMKLVPADATFFVTKRFDVAAFLKATRDALAETDPQAVRPFNQGVGAIQLAVGINPLDGLLEPMGSDWVLYSSPRTGSGVLGMVAANKLDDPAKFEANLKVAVAGLMTWINTGVNRANASPTQLTIHTSVAKVGDVSVNYVSLPLVAPAWTVRGGKLFVGLYPQSVGAAARVADKPGASIADSPKYQAILKRLGSGPASLDGFYDLPTSVAYGSMYSQLLAMTRYAGFGDLYGLTLPEPLLPPMDVLLDHVAPAGSASWSDSNGWHSKSVTPFPGSTLLTDQGAIASAVVVPPAVTVGVLLPSLNRARETANRVKSASNLKQIGMAILLYSNENNGKYPPDLGKLVTDEELVAQVFVNPRRDASVAPPPPDATPAQQAQFVNEHSDYVYLGAGRRNDVGAEVVIAHENPDGLSDGINILFGDGHVEFVPMAQATRMIEGAKAK